MNKVLCVKKCPYFTYVNMNYKRNESFSKGFIYLRSQYERDEIEIQLSEINVSSFIVCSTNVFCCNTD